MKKVFVSLVTLCVLVVPNVLLAENICYCPCEDNGNTNINQNENINTNQNVNDSPVVYSDQIIINEFLPDPAGEDGSLEFIELKNIGQEDVDLLSWQVSDASRSYTISGDDFSSTSIEAGGFFVLYRSVTNIALNNSGEESISFLQPNEQTLDRIVYTGSEEGKSYSLNSEGEWQLSDPTPGEENITEENNQNDTNGNTNNNLNINQAQNSNINLNQNQNNNENINVNTNNNANSNSNANSNQPVVYSSEVIINEFYPDPVGDEVAGEFIELKNNSSTDIDLTGWQISDATDKNYTLSGIISANNLFVVYRSESGITLNNGADQVELFQPDGNLLSVVQYTGSKESLSYAFDGENWQWAKTPTPAEQNIFDQNGNTNSKAVGVVGSSKVKNTNILASTPKTETISLPVKNQKQQILYGLIAGAATLLISAGAVGMKYYRKKQLEK